MSDNQTMGFGKFVPGFDFLQNLAKGATQSLPQMPNLANWVAPTLNVEELEKRIGELKAVHFWLDQNSKALGATIQALEVQKMTLATLKGMNFAMEDITNALKLRTADAMMGGLKKGPDGPAASSSGSGSSGSSRDPGGEIARDGAGAADAGAAPGAPDDGKSESDDRGSRAQAKSRPGKSAAKDADSQPAASVIDPMQWWGSLTQQFQQIAATAMKDVAAHPAMDAARNMAGGMAREALDPAAGAATGRTKAAPKKASARKAPAKKAPAKRAKKGSA
jgi:hypothetical protein